MLTLCVFNSLVVALNVYVKKYLFFVSAVVKYTSAKYLYVVGIYCVYACVNNCALVDKERLIALKLNVTYVVLSLAEVNNV